MKKLLVSLLTAVLCLSMFACGSDAEETPKEDGKGTSATTGKPEGPAVKEEKELVLYREWKDAKNGHAIVINEDGTYTAGDKQYSCRYDEEDQIVYMDSAPYEIIQKYGVYMLVFDEYQYLVGAENYEAVHALFVEEGKKEIAESGTVVRLGEAYRLMCGASFTVDKVELGKGEGTVLKVYLTCKNGNDEGCEEFGSIRGNWTSLDLGCPFDLSTEDAYVDAKHPTRDICLTFQTNRLTPEELQTRSDDSYGYFRLYFSAGKESYYIDINEFFKD